MMSLKGSQRKWFDVIHMCLVNRVAETAEDVVQNWQEIKQEEKGIQQDIYIG